ncbi:MAG: aminopeptidase, partial [Aquificaceae bacterium]|nr:aminopeptidase [Aquificaceae bacterium]
MYEAHIYRLYRVNLNLGKEESLLVFTDTEKDYLAELLEEFVAVGEGVAGRVKHILYTSLGAHGKEPPEEVWRLTFGDEAVDKLAQTGLLEKVLLKEDYSEAEVLEMLLKHGREVPQVVVAFPYYSTTHTFFRKALTQGFG